ncbi:MAG TPA: LysR family transcriptional regulator [Beijerinckiaceae bacterium]|nr:LysR family transcriptional regulator [Beijerinckiaceae bacterium]
MEMHQVRYFLTVARTLNFTRAAEECNVAQPSLTRAIKHLEGELGGDLFRRERPAAQLTELGQRMHPLLKQCYDAAVGARSLASSFKKGEVGALRLGLSHSIDLSLLLPHLTELKRLFAGLEFVFLRGSSKEIAEALKKGDIELAIAAELDDDWDRFDVWSLFDEPFYLVFNPEHELAARNSIEARDLAKSHLLSRRYCEHSERLNESIRAQEVALQVHEVSSERDLMQLVEANIGIAVVPRSARTPQALRLAEIADLDLSRTVHLYGVAGRQRTAVAAAILRLLRGADWSQYSH